MSHLVARILLATFVLPLGALVYVALFLTVDRDRGGLIAWFIPGAVTWFVVAVYWTALWRNNVPLTTERRTATLGVTAGAAIAAVIIGGPLTYLNGEVGMVVGTSLAPLLWLIGTTLVWRETFQERGKRLRRSDPNALICPRCAYNLTGLKEARCPECGTQYTLEQLFAAQPSRAQVELYD